jgi:cytoskeletal protein CcmA (bactofilin family)
MANTGNTQQQINYGAAVNDGEGDPLRTAFIKTDDNFDNVWLAGPVGSNITITNNTVQVNNTNGNLILSPNGVGAIQTNSRLLPRLNNTYDFGSTTLKYRTGYFGAGGLIVDGNVTVAGNLTAGNISYTGNVFVGDLQGSVYADDSTIMVDAVDNELFAGRATISGNISADYFVGNGRQLTGLAASYGNANVAAYLPTYTGNLSSGNLTVSSGSDLWTISGQFLTGPGGAYWHSHPEQSSDDFVSAPGSDITINSIDANGVTESKIVLTSADIELTVINGISRTWRLTESGVTEFPGCLTPVVAAGGCGNIGNVSNPWANAYFSGNVNAGNITTTNNITADYFFGNTQGLIGNITNLDSVNFAVENIGALVGNNGVNIGAGGNNNLVVLPTEVIIQNVPLTVAGNILSTVAGGLNITANTVANGTAQTWNFNTTGNLTFPDDTVQTTAWTGILPNPTYSGSDEIGEATPAPLNLNNSAEATLLTQLNLINTGGGAGSGSAIDFWTYTSINDVPEVRLQAVDDGDYSADFSIALKGTGNSGNNGLTTEWQFGTDGNLTAPGSISTTIGGATLVFGSATASAFPGLKSTTNITFTANSAGTARSMYFYGDGTLDVPGNVAGANLTTGGQVVATGNITGGNIVTAGNVSGNTAGYAIGYRDIPQISFTGNATIATTDAGKHYYSTQSSNYILTIANNASQGFQVGAAITIVNQGTGNITIAQGPGVTLYLAGNASSGNRSVATFGMATIMKTATDTWFINGTGVS